ncbi:structural protein [Cellulophaga phage phi48:2]|uniref:structural protein n=1 Tax=Cellulophaga phage phi48:2 TaxID=1327968 RepID=UPI000351775E|nr:structural protein [Cellulophaga phage phi48:2]AGO47270.1 structural protein [Cellulophaga phage phi48:2]
MQTYKSFKIDSSGGLNPSNDITFEGDVVFSKTVKGVNGVENDDFVTKEQLGKYGSTATIVTIEQENVLLDPSDTSRHYGYISHFTIGQMYFYEFGWRIDLKTLNVGNDYIFDWSIETGVISELIYSSFHVQSSLTGFALVGDASVMEKSGKLRVLQRYHMIKEYSGFMTFYLKGYYFK